MRVFVTGICGQLGHDVMNALQDRGHQSIGSDVTCPVADIDYVQLDITDQDAVAVTIAQIRPDAVIHCAAWTAVDAAEEEENREKVDAVNHLGKRYIAEAAKAVGAKI